MEVELREINRTNWLQCVKLTVNDSQKDFAAPAAWSLVRAAYEPDTYPLGIYCDNVIAGLVTYACDPDMGIWEMLDLTIDEKYQGRGIGTAAVKKLLGIVTERLGNIKFYTTVTPENNAARNIYEKIGFQLTGRVIYDELEMEIQL